MFLDYFRDYPAAVSVAAVAIGWFATRRGQIQGDRAKHSHGYLGILEKPDYLSSLKTLSPLLDKGTIYNEEAYLAEERDRYSQAIWDCLQVMERAAIDIDMGYISEEYFYKKYRTLTERLFLIAHPFINKVRVEKNSGTIYKNFEALYIRVHFKRKPITLRLLEYFKVCPNFRASSSIFAAHLRTLDKGFLKFVWEVMRYRSLPGKIEYVARNDKMLFRSRIRQLVALECAVIGAIVLLIYI